MDASLSDYGVKEVTEPVPLGHFRLNPHIRLRSAAFIESIMPEINRAMGRERAPKKTAAEMDRTIVSCLLGNLIAGEGKPVIIKMSNNQK